MDKAIISFITLLQEYPLIGFAIAMVILGLMFLLKKVLLRAMTPPANSTE